MEAAIAGGVTSLACPPDTDPPLDEPGLVEMLKHRARLLNQAHVYPIGALTVQLKGTTLTEMGELAEAGCVAFSHADMPLVDTQVLLRAMQYASTFGYRVWLRPSDPHLGRDRRRARRRGGDAARPARHSGGGGDDRAHDDPRAGARDRRARAPVPLVDGRGRGAWSARRRRRACRSPATWRFITCTCATSTSAGSIPTRTWCRRCARRATAPHCAPAWPTARSTSSAPTTRPVDDDGKQVPFGEAEPGATGLELLLPLTLKWAAEEKVALPAALARITSEPAKLLGVRGRRPSRRQCGRHLRIRSGAILDRRAQGAEEPGQEHAVPRHGGAGQGALHAGGRAGRVRSVTQPAVHARRTK